MDTSQYKALQRQAWSLFSPFEVVTGSVAPRLVKFAGIRRGTDVLDVGCGTGVVALAAARMGANVVGLDLTSELLARAKENAELSQVEIQWQEGDAEQMPFGNASFNVVVSQFGHMFAPRPDVAVREMLRVLKPGGTIAFSTWPPELYTGRVFALVGKYSPPLPTGVSSPIQWGDPGIVRERLGNAVDDVVFDCDTMKLQGLSPAHIRVMTERSVGPVISVAKSLESDPSKLTRFRRELEENISLYFEDNVLRQDYLLTRATKI